LVPNLDPVSVDSVTFVALSGTLALLAWSPARRIFLPALTVAGVLMALSWLDWKDLVAMSVFLPVPYLAAKALWGRKEKDATALIAAVIACQVILFLIFKRYPWFDILGWIDHPVVVVGISYILFRQLHLVIDARFLGHSPFSLMRYLGFMLSPWTLIAGPIQRYDAFCKGLDSVGRPETLDLLAGAHRAINGLIMAFVFAPVFLEPSRISNLANTHADWTDFLVVLYGFPIYLYLNFAGYTEIMIGAARICGFSNLPENFNKPYLAVNTRDFWTRWHISFGLWIKHYVFTPLCTRLFAYAAPKWHWLMMLIAVLIAFYIVGVWHGTTLNYLAFGVLQGFGVIISAAFEHMRKRVWGFQRAREINNSVWFRAGSIFVTFHFTCVTFLLLNDHPDRLTEAFGVFFGLS
jgi:D-alanyl-lipoteichoic acid acyltransferase DltB (MBOAT superfamily)